MGNKSAKEWIEVHIRVLPSYLEMLSAFVFASGAQGIQEEENGFTVFYDAQDWSPEVHKLLLAELQRVVPDFTTERMQVRTRANEDWLSSWKRNFRPFHLTETLVIQPDWEQYRAKPGETVLTIAPKMAFGTGHHETTQLCLFLMDAYLQPGMAVLDVGCGSGILSIYARKKGAASVLGIDNDPVAIENAYENLQLNGIDEGVTFKVSDAHDFVRQRFDLVVANINRNVLLEIADGLQGATAPGGVLLLSGILATDRSLMLEAFVGGAFALIDEKQKGEWIGLALKRKQEEDD